MKPASRRAWAALAVALLGIPFVLARHPSMEPIPAAPAATLRVVTSRAKSAETLQRADPAKRANEGEQAVRSTTWGDAVPTAEFWCRVVSDVDDRPVAGAEIGLPLGFQPDEEFHAIATTDSEGLFCGPIELEHTTSFEVRAAGFARTNGSVDYTHPHREEPSEVRLMRSSTLEVHVQPGDALPPDACVWVVAHDPRRIDGVQIMNVNWMARLSVDGRATVRDVPPHVGLQVEVVSDGDDTFRWASADFLVLEPGETRSLEVDLRAGATLVVSVRDASGNVVADRTLFLLRMLANPVEPPASGYLDAFFDGTNVSDSQQTDGSGRAVFHHVQPGGWWVGPDAGDDVAPVAHFVNVPDVGESSLEILEEPGLFLRGRVLTPAGAQSGEMTVVATHETIGGEVRANVGADGTFVLGPVAAGPHRVRALPKGEFLAPEPVLAMPNGDDITIQLLPAAAIAGRVVDATTGKDAFADVVCSRAGDDAPTLATVDGGFRLGGLPSGTYTLAATASDERATLVRGLRVDAGDTITDVRVALEPAARARIRYRGGPAHASVSLRIDDAIVAIRGLTEGVELECVVPAGRLDVRLSGDQRELARRTIDARAGVATEIVLEVD
jgi:carboxypeptidase family protein